MTAHILAALAKLDPGNDGHWTADGLPRLETVRLFAADPGVAREHVTAAAPGFSRVTPTLPSAPQAATGQGVATQAPAAPLEAAGALAGALAGAADAAVEGGNAAQGPGVGDGATTDTADTTAASAETALDRAAAALAAAQRAKDEADQAYAAALAAHDEALTTAAPAAEPLSATLAGYLQQQQRERDKRAAVRASIRASGVNLQELVKAQAAAPIDAAFRRNTARGTKRPGS